MVTLPKILILALIQGATELLPVSSSAHVIVAEKLMGLNPSSPAMTFLLVMLHTGTMVAVIVFFWNSWKADFFKSPQTLKHSINLLIAATIATVGMALVLKVLVQKVLFKGAPHAEIEQLFGNLPLMAAALAAAGVLILWAGYNEGRVRGGRLGAQEALLIGLVQGICLPFRGFSRSGATISTGLLLGIEKKKAEDFSFALAVILTPAVIAAEALRFLKAQHAHTHLHHTVSVVGLFGPGLIGMVLSFISGLLALKWLSSWLEAGRWYLFGIYCLCASILIFFLHSQGL